MTQKFRSLQLNIPGLGCWVTLLVFAWLLGALGLGWLVKSVLVLLVLMLALPVVAVVGLRFWLRRNLVSDSCPVCGQALSGLAPLQIPCPSCGTLLLATRQGFERVTPEGTIEVQAVNLTDETQPAQRLLTLDVDAVDPVDVNNAPDADVPESR